MNILILGGDGYLGWPTAMFFSNKGFQVTVVDNYFRRMAGVELNVEPLNPTPNLIGRAQIWHKNTGKEIKVIIADLTNPTFTRSIFNGSINYNFNITPFSGPPHIVVHYAEQPSAPYSMINHHKALFTLTNNLVATANLIYAIKDISPKTHIIKLGTMGEYGTPNIDIEEGWIDIEHNGRKDKFLFPRAAGSLYHTTKIMDTDLLWFAVRMWKLRVTDLMQGPVYGFETDETLIDENLLPHFNYDEIFGTVLNRFIAQAISGHPLTIYGKGGQTRGYINLRDTIECINLASLNPAKEGELRIFNQVTEIFSVNELAEKVQNVGHLLGFDVESKNIENPRIEKEEHYYNPKYTAFRELGLKPHLLTDETLAKMFQTMMKYKSNIHKYKIFRGIRW